MTGARCHRTRDSLAPTRHRTGEVKNSRRDDPVTCRHPTGAGQGQARQAETSGTVADAELLALAWWRELRNLVGPHDRDDGSLPWA